MRKSLIVSILICIISLVVSVEVYSSKMKEKMSAVKQAPTITPTKEVYPTIVLPTAPPSKVTITFEDYRKVTPKPGDKRYQIKAHQ